MWRKVVVDPHELKYHPALLPLILTYFMDVPLVLYPFSPPPPGLLFLIFLLPFPILVLFLQNQFFLSRRDCIGYGHEEIKVYYRISVGYRC